MAIEFQHNKKGKIVLVETKTGELHEFNYTIDASEALALKDADGRPRYAQPSSSVGMKRSAEKEAVDKEKEEETEEKRRGRKKNGLKELLSSEVSEEDIEKDEK